MLEGPVQSRIRAAAAYSNVMLWRNNSGAFRDKNNRLIRFGLGNDSAKVNRDFKSADLIGLTPVLITQEMVGTVVGIFTASEAKKSDWTYEATDREVAQKNFIDTVVQYGGYAGFARSVDDFYKIIKVL